MLRPMRPRSLSPYLCLALALSDLVSHKTSIDSLFLDEGFGTLDGETLEVARLELEDFLRGSFLDPTVLTGTRPEMCVNCQEVFAPVKTVEPYDDFSEAIRRVNNSPYGLQAGVFARDARLLFQAYEELEVGGVIAGDIPGFRLDHMPYGGMKDSGLGREGLRYAIEEMTDRKILVMNLK